MVDCTGPIRTCQRKSRHDRRELTVGRPPFYAAMACALRSCRRRSTPDHVRTRHRRWRNQDRLPAGRRRRTGSRVGARTWREPADARRAGSRKGAPRGDGQRAGGRADGAGRDLPRHRRRRPAARQRDHPRHHAPHRPQGARAGRQRRVGGAGGRRRRRGPGHRADRRHRVDLLRPQRGRAAPPGPADGATSWATRAAAGGSAARRCPP